MTKGLKPYLLTVALFVAAMAVKVYNDLPHWNGSLSNYAASTIIIIPIVWYAGYFWPWRGDDDKPQ